MNLPPQALADLLGAAFKRTLDECMRGRASGMPNARASHVFSRIATSAQVWEIPDTPVPDVGWTTERIGRFHAPRLWQVSSGCVEFLRNAGDPVSPLSTSEILERLNYEPFGETGGTSTLGLRVIASADGVSKVFDMDLGQTIELYAERIDVQLYGTSSAFQVRTDITSGTIGSGTVADTVVGVSLNPIEESRGAAQVRRSQILSATANNNVTFTVPRYAVRASFSQNAAGLAPVTFDRFVGDPRTLGANARNVGTIDFVGRNAPDVPLGPETHIQSNTDAAARVYEVAWLLQP